MNFVELRAKATALDAEFSETETSPVEQFEVSGEELIFDGNSFPMDQSARNRLLERVGAPVGYLRSRSIGLQVDALREHLQKEDFGRAPKLVIRRGELFTISHGELIELSHSEVLAAIGDSLGPDASGLSVSRIEEADGQLELELVGTAKSLEIRQGDVVKAGLHVSHSRYGEQATQIQSFIYRLVCSNGMTRRECVSGEGIVRTRRLPADHPRGKDLLLDQIRRLTARTWRQLEPQLAELRSTSERKADVQQVLKQWLQRTRISTRVSDDRVVRTMMDRLLSAWREEGSENTYYGAVNALTRVGSHDPALSARQRRVLSLLGGLLAFSGVHICPRCFSLLSSGVSAPGHSGRGQDLLTPEIGVCRSGLRKSGISDISECEGEE
jgi:hypothetical protein